MRISLYRQKAEKRRTRKMDEYIPEYDTQQNDRMGELAMMMAAQDEYENRIRIVVCDICGDSERGTEKGLRAIGWELGRGYEICYMHGEV
jgi:hypothetical protein